MHAYEAFTTSMALKRHFTSDYDMFKYQGKLSNTDYNKFETRRDKYQFHKLSKLTESFQNLQIIGRSAGFQYLHVHDLFERAKNIIERCDFS